MAGSSFRERDTAGQAQDMIRRELAAQDVYSAADRAVMQAADEASRREYMNQAVAAATGANVVPLESSAGAYRTGGRSGVWVDQTGRLMNMAPGRPIDLGPTAGWSGFGGQGQFIGFPSAMPHVLYGGYMDTLAPYMQSLAPFLMAAMQRPAVTTAPAAGRTKVAAKAGPEKRGDPYESITTSRRGDPYEAVGGDPYITDSTSDEPSFLDNILQRARMLFNNSILSAEPIPSPRALPAAPSRPGLAPGGEQLALPPGSAGSGSSPRSGGPSLGGGSIGSGSGGPTGGSGGPAGGGAGSNAMSWRDILRNTIRGGDLLKQMLRFGERRVPQLALLPTSVTDMLMSAGQMPEERRAENIRLYNSIPPEQRQPDGSVIVQDPAGNRGLLMPDGTIVAGGGWA